VSDLPRPIAISRVSIFDLDRTITRHGTWSPFLLFVARRCAPWRLVFIPGVILAMASYKLGLISRARLKEYMHAAMIGRRIRKEKLSCLADQFAEHILETGIYPQALALIRAERNAGREVIIATAAHHFYAARLAERCGVESLVSTQSRHIGDWLTSEIAGQNCYGTAKCAMLAEHFHKRGIDRHTVHVRFYSDDLSDLPTFAWADEPVAVNPSRKLAEHAARSGWLILDWRQKALRRNSPTRASLRPEAAPIMPTSL
jgi:HAD superfamily hydrolase (TIGR01490 family)